MADGAAGGGALTSRYTSPFDESIASLLAFAGLGPSGGDVRGHARYARTVGLLRKHDLARRAPVVGTRLSGHVSNASAKAALRTLLLDDASGVAAELRHLRERLDYGGEEDVEARRRRWRLAAMVSTA